MVPVAGDWSKAVPRVRCETAATVPWSRDAWESRMFNGAYTGASASEKVKYGVMNTTGDQVGVASAHQYGEHYLMLKPRCC